MGFCRPETIITEWDVAQIVAVGEILVEMMATAPDQGFRHPGSFAGPYPSGAPAIMPRP